MTENNHTVIVAKDLADLIPVFFRNRQKEIETLRSALDAGDFKQLAQLGHRMKGRGQLLRLCQGVGDRQARRGQRQDRGQGRHRTPASASTPDYLAKVQVVYE